MCDIFFRQLFFFFERLECRHIIKKSYMRCSLHINTHTQERILKVFCYFCPSLKNLELPDTF